MFLGMSKAAVLKQLKTPRGMFGAWLLAIRITPYILHFLTAETEELLSSQSSSPAVGLQEV